MEEEEEEEEGMGRGERAIKRSCHKNVGEIVKRCVFLLLLFSCPWTAKASSIVSWVLTCCGRNRKEEENKVCRVELVNHTFFSSFFFSPSIFREICFLVFLWIAMDDIFPHTKKYNLRCPLSFFFLSV